ncbi:MULTISPECIES: lycopene cyclase family protein [Mycobacteriaceae]|uniref:lycopene cyclase family protein n=1 Tax=Mycobacteriaceae TaxID=1762 RepID=UPI00080055FE|nr:lycopene cyclase family protein [Mycolicibacterium sp. F2034L]MCK0177479.1 lycopene cyclase family protein [Mycolicibacterium sp. F2034L]OBB61546.1 lycopene cyclase [Mycobacterium sp. 852013-51886_SCH5428379]
MDVLVVGGGPAGMALAGACGRLGLETGLLDPAPERPWTATYGMWSRELPVELPESVVAARAVGRAIALTEHDLGWEYAVLDVPTLFAHLTGRLTAVRVHTGRAVGSPQRGVVTLADGSSLRAAVVVDAGGWARPLAGAGPGHTAAAQTAYGVVLDDEAAAPLTSSGEALFMDWRADHGETGWPTFLYVVPLGGGEVLVEETSLARRPGLSLTTLRRRLHARLAHHGIIPPDGVRTERVSFPVDHPRHRGYGVLGFGAAAPLIHPATGFSLAASLGLAPRVAAAIAEHLPRDPARALTAAQDTVWPVSAKIVHRLRRIGLEALLRMPPQEVPGFFEQFFALPEVHRWTYLTGRDDLGGHIAAMNHLFAASNGRLRRRLVASAFVRPVRTNDA